MNNEINELYRKIGVDFENFQRVTVTDDDMRRFAELLIKECVGLCNRAAEESARSFNIASQAQELGPALVAKGGQVQAEKLANLIQQHFDSNS